MAVKRVVTNIATSNVDAAQTFYGELLGMQIAMDFRWIVTFTSDETMSPQVSFMTEGGSGTPVPDLSIEVDNLDEVLRRVREADIPVEYGPANEPWGVTRFFVRDPFGRLVNILSHN